MGIEPTTSWSQVVRASNWAIGTGYSSILMLGRPLLQIVIEREWQTMYIHNLNLHCFAYGFGPQKINILVPSYQITEHSVRKAAENDLQMYLVITRNGIDCFYVHFPICYA